MKDILSLLGIVWRACSRTLESARLPESQDCLQRRDIRFIRMKILLRWEERA